MSDHMICVSYRTREDGHMAAEIVVDDLETFIAGADNAVRMVSHNTGIPVWKLLMALGGTTVLVDEGVMEVPGKEGTGNMIKNLCSDCAGEFGKYFDLKAQLKKNVKKAVCDRCWKSPDEGCMIYEVRRKEQANAEAEKADALGGGKETRGCADGGGHHRARHD